MRLSRTIRVVRRSVAVSRTLGKSRAFSTFYTKDHEYLKADGEIYVMGISDHAQQELGDVVFVEMPEAGSSFEQVTQCHVSCKCVNRLPVRLGRGLWLCGECQGCELHLCSS